MPHAEGVVRWGSVQANRRCVNFAVKTQCLQSEAGPRLPAVSDSTCWDFTEVTEMNGDVS